MKHKKLLKQSISTLLKNTFPNSYQLQEKIIETGLKNASIISKFPHRSWPFWVHSQLQTQSKNDIDDPSYLGLFNKKHRNWTHLSDIQSNQAALIDPYGLIHVTEKNFSIDFWISNSNSLCIPNQTCRPTQEFFPKSNSIQTLFNISQLNITAETFFSELPENNSAAFTQYSIKNTTQKNIKLSFYIAIRPYNLEGITSIEKIDYIKKNAFIIDKKLALILNKKPDNIVCLSHTEGDVSEHFNSLDMILKTKCSLKLASAFAEYKLIISPQKTQKISIQIPGTSTTFHPLSWPFITNSKKLYSAIDFFNSFSFEKTIKDLTHKYKSICLNTLSVNLPNKQMSHFINTQQHYTLASLNKKSTSQSYYSSIQDSPLDTILIAKIFYQTNHPQALYKNCLSKKKLKTIYRQIQSQELNFTDLAPWFDTIKYLKESNAITLNKIHYYYLEKIIQWGISQLFPFEKTPYKLLPKRLCKTTKTPHLFLSDSLGLLLSIEAYTIILNKKISSILVEIPEALKTSITWFCNNISTKTALENIIPVTSSIITSLESIKTILYYLNAFPDDHIRIQNSLLKAQKHLLFNKMIFSMINPTGYPVKTNIIYANLLKTLDPSTFFLFIEKILSFASSTYTFPDVIHPRTQGGSEGDGHNITLSSTLLECILSSIITEHETHLELFQGIPTSWLTNENWFIQNLNTSIGTLSLNVKQSETETTIYFTFSKKRTTKFFKLFPQLLYSSYTLDNLTEPCAQAPISIPLTTNKITLKKATHGSQ